MTGIQPANVGDEKNRVALLSAVASAGLALAKIVAAIATGSLSMLSEAIHSLIDFGATIVTMFAVRIGTRPADDDHHFGHAKVESLAALLETILLVVTACTVSYLAVKRLFAHETDVEFSPWAVGLLLVSIVVDYNRSRALSKAAESTSSDALAADALHFDADMWSSGAAIIGFIGIYLGLQWADSLMAILISLFIAWNAYHLARRAVATLLDEAPAGITDRIRTQLQDSAEVLRVAQIRVRPAGPTLFVDTTIDIRRTLPILEIAALKSQLTADLVAQFPSADVTIAANAVEVDNETAFEKVNLIARHHALAIHHLLVQKIEGKLAVSFDIEVDGSMSLDAAHSKATILESAIRESFGAEVEVESHIEPLPERMLFGSPASEKRHKSFQTKLQRFAARQKILSDIHNVRVRETDDGILLHYHCRFPGMTSVSDVHAAVDHLEDLLKADNESIRRVVAHAEPLKAERHSL
jgi:cation diffusion facilitator family transporter